MSVYFEGIEKIKYEGKKSKNPLAFHHYDADGTINGKKMKDILRFSVAYWHTFCFEGKDMFGGEIGRRAWNNYEDALKASVEKADAAFEFMSKLGVGYFCTHDRDLAPELETLGKTNDLLDRVLTRVKENMDKTGIKMLWGTANLFSSPKFTDGAATSSDPEVFAYAAAQVKKALEFTNDLGGENYVFWGGREGYETLLNSNTELELDNLARFLSMSVDYAHKIGFKGQFLIEPKPKEPTKHQYDYDAATAYAFLKKYGLEKHFKFNIEANHATLAGHTFQHELRMARLYGSLGSVDANMGDYLLGWDTDQFPTNIYDAIWAMYEILKNGGIAPGGLNFDAKIRRNSTDIKDLFKAHIAGMDTFAAGLKIAAGIMEDGKIDGFVKQRYEGYDSGMGARIRSGDTNLAELEEYIIDKSVSVPKSGSQESLEAMVNDCILNYD